MRAIKYFYGTLITLFLMIWVGENGNSLSIIQKSFIALFVVTIIFVVLFFVWNRKERVKVGKIKAQYKLDVLDNSQKPIYLLKTRGANHLINYHFSYTDEDGKKVTVDTTDIEVREISGKVAYVEYYNNRYVPNGFLDYLFYNEKNNENTICILYMKKDMIKFKI